MAIRAVRPGRVRRGLLGGHVHSECFRAGIGEATETSHTAGCGDSTSTGNTFTIETLNADGSGTANLTCGTGCGFNYSIQVSPDRSVINLVDASSANPGNFQIGTAIHE
jgi:hypothetical protein